MREDRIDIDASVILEIIDITTDEQTSLTTEIENISLNGMQLRSTMDVRLQQGVGIRILQDENDFRLNGIVRWCDPEEGSYSLGVLIDEEDSLDFKQWAEFIDSTQNPLERL